ncbi:hypothetical protein BGZ74_011041 [Mortierella antarctica]|nr:hypothetical protein BGZ74_011041 [Mortierella antarctica]
MVQKQERLKSPEVTSATQAESSQTIRDFQSARGYSLQVKIKIYVKIKVKQELKEAIKKSIEGTASTTDEKRFQRKISQKEESIKVSEQDEEWVEKKIPQTTKEYVPWAVIKSKDQEG